MLNSNYIIHFYEMIYYQKKHAETNRELHFTHNVTMFAL